MPLNNGLEALSDNLEIIPIAETEVESMLALIMRNQQPVSSLAEKCFADAQVILINRAGDGRALLGLNSVFFCRKRLAALSDDD